MSRIHGIVTLLLQEAPAGSRSTRATRANRGLVPSASTSSLTNGHGGGSNGSTSNGGSPTGGGSTSDARSKRRRAVDDELDSMFNPTVLEDFLNAMMKHADGWPFDRPITKADAPDYHKIIKKPIDLGTIRSKIIRMKYSCNQVRVLASS